MARFLLGSAIITLLAVALGSGVPWDAQPGSAGAGGGNVIVTVDTTGIWTSLALDSSGNPVVSYYDPIDDDLRILHCSNPNCSSGNSVTLPDTEGDVGWFTSLVLDADGNPVVSYYDNTNDDLKILHCNDPDCAGDDESITSPDRPGAPGMWSSLVLDASGNPVVSYFGDTLNDLKILHCNDPDCAGDDESITTPDTSGSVGTHTSLVLDGSGNPVVSYRGGANLKLLHCGNANCGPGNVITSPGKINPFPPSGLGRYTSLALDSSGNPVVSYDGSHRLNVLHCNDASCAGNDDSISSPSIEFRSGQYTSLVLDGSGNPVVSYYNGGDTDLELLHCNDANCVLGGDSITSPDTASVSGYTSLALDASGNPVVSYGGGGNLRILHCGNANCAETVAPTATSPAPDPATPTSPATGTPAPTATSTPTSPAPGTPAPTATPGMLGDVNCDGRVNSLDALAILQFSAGLLGSLVC